MAQKFRRCGHCRGTMPADYDECPHCNRPLEHYGKAGQWLDSLLPDDRPMTKLSLGFAAAVYAMVGLLAGGTSLVSPSVYSLVHFGANFPPLVLEGEIWRLPTSVFLHGDILHLAFNGYALWIVGSLVERSFGKSRYLVAFMLTGLLAALASMGWGFVATELRELLPIPWVFDGVSILRPSVGMSGALTGLIGVGVAAGKKVNNELGDQVSRQFLKWMLFIGVFGIAVPGVDNAAHIGGFLAGLPLGWLMPLKDTASTKVGWAYATGGIVAALIAVGSVVTQGASLPDYPRDSGLYPTAIFGNEVRPGDDSDSTFKRAVDGCRETLEAIEGGSTDAALKTKGLETCGLAAHINFSNPALRLYEAAALAYAGETDRACRKAKVGLITLDYDGGFDRGGLDAHSRPGFESIVRETCR